MPASGGWDPNEPSFFELHPRIGHHGWEEEGDPRLRDKPAEARATEQPGLDIVDVGLDDAPISPRQWLLGNLFCRGFLSSLLGDGATGKTAFRVACALAMAAARKDIVDENVFVRCRVLYLSFEDGWDEIRRRFRAAMIHHGVERRDVEGYLYVSALSRPELKLATQRRSGEVIVGGLAKLLEQQIERLGLDVVIFDPLVKTHAVQENDNTAMDQVANIMSTLAAKHDISVDAPHHTRKGSGEPGDADVGRGGSATKDAGRLVYTLTKMAPKEAELLGLSDDERRYRVRHDSAKVNIAPPTAKTKWLRLVDVELGNKTADYPHGDRVQTVEIWRAKDLWADLSVVTLNAALDELDRGIVENGAARYFSDHGQAKDRAAWHVVQRHAPELTESQAREIIKTWVRNDVLRPTAYLDPATRREQKGLRVNNAKRPG